MNSGGVISGTPSAAANASFTVKVIGTNSLFSTKTFTLVLGAGAPAVTTVSPLAAGAVGTAYSQTLTASGGVSPYSWSISSGSLPAGLTLSSDGAISGMPSVSGNFSFTVKVTGGNSLFSARVLNIAVGAGAPSITTVTPLASGTVGTAYSKTLTASGGATPYSWSISSGSLPAGLSLSSTGVISGTPVSAANAGFTVKVRGTNGMSSTKDFAIAIGAGTPAILTVSLPAGTVGVAYNQTLSSTGGKTPYTWAVSAGALPAGLSLSSSGVLTGTPASVGTASCTLRVTGANGLYSTKDFTITIVVGAPTIFTPSPLSAGNAGVPYSQAFTATGGTTPYSWSVISGSLPPGLSMSSAGVLSGTSATPVDIYLSVRVTGANALFSTKIFHLTMALGAPAVTTSSPLPGGKIGTTYSQTLSATGGLMPFVWNVDSGNLPGGLALSGSGVISGQPTVAGSFNFIVL